MIHNFLAALVFLGTIGLCAAAEEQPPGLPGSDEAHYAFHRSGDGYVRLDLRTGEVADCRQETAGWTCVPGADERALLDAQISRLQRQNALLKNELLAHGIPLSEALGDAATASPPAATPPAATSDRLVQLKAEMDGVFNAMQRAWNRVRDMAANIQHDLQKNDSQRPDSERQDSQKNESNNNDLQKKD
jgi:hypothetical protein